MFYIIGHKLGSYFCILIGSVLLVVSLLAFAGVPVLDHAPDPTAPLIAKIALVAVSLLFFAVGIWQHYKAEQYAYERKVNKARRKADKKKFRNPEDYNDFMKKELDS